MKTDVYSPREIALAAGVSEEQVISALARPDSPATVEGFIRHADAVSLGRMLAAKRTRTHVSGDSSPKGVRPLFALFADGPATSRTATVPIALSSTLHIGLIAVAVFVATFNLAPRAATIADDRPADPMHLVFLATPGPGGGGGGGGLQQKAPPPKAMREGRHAINSPVPTPKPIVEQPAPPEPLKSEQLPAVIAPIVNSPADARTRIGVLEETKAAAETQGPGAGGGGAGTGNGTGLGQGSGSGVGPGSGGGIGGGPYRPGSGIQPPRVLREVKADYSEDARRRGITGEVVLEIVVRRDGSVGSGKMLQGLGLGLDDRAIGAVRQSLV